MIPPQASLVLQVGQQGDPKGYEAGVFGQGATGVMGAEKMASASGVSAADSSPELSGSVVRVRINSATTPKEPVSSASETTRIYFRPLTRPSEQACWASGEWRNRRGGRGTRRRLSMSGAQVRLVPEKVDEVKERPIFTPIAPTFPSLPKSGLRGDLMSVVDHLGQATLWFCVTRTVLVGPHSGLR